MSWFTLWAVASGVTILRDPSICASSSLRLRDHGSFGIRKISIKIVLIIG